jgi:succinate dehydrogenase/fumarate reductase cytochrome b subunit
MSFEILHRVALCMISLFLVERLAFCSLYTTKYTAELYKVYTVIYNCVVDQSVISEKYQY